MPKKMKSKQEIWIPISIFYVAESVIPNVFFPSCGYCRNSLIEDRGLFKRLACNGERGETLLPCMMLMFVLGQQYHMCRVYQAHTQVIKGS